MRKRLRRRALSLFTAFLMVYSLVMYLPNEITASADGNLEAALQWAIAIANDNSHGYSQSSRWGPDYDCSSFVISALKNAGFDTGSATYTGNMIANLTPRGFTWIPWSSIKKSSNLKRGDILLNVVQHTEFYLGNGQNVGAHSNRGYPASGDQTGTEVSVSGYYNHPWDGVLRYNGSTPTQRIDTEIDNLYPKNVSYTAPKQIYTYTAYGVKEGNRWASKGDPCTIVEAYTSGYCKIIYPASGVNREAYALISDCSGYEPRQANHSPIGHVDLVEGGEGKVHIRGWAFDEDNSSKSLEIHVYIGGPYNGHPNLIHAVGGILANQSSEDVTKAHGVSGNHRFDTWIATTARGNQEVYIYAIDANDSSGNAMIGNGSANISKTPPPSISDIKIKDVSVSGYTIECTVSDKSGCGIDRVQFPTWTLKEQDDIISDWPTNPKASGTINGNTVTYRVNRSDHNNEYGTYRTHIYAYDKSGNSVCVAAEDVKVGVGQEISSGAGQTIPDGDYIIVSELGHNIYLDIPEVAYPAPEGIDVAICNASSLPGKDGLFDTWTVTYLGDGFYSINQNGKEITLDVKNDSLNVGTEIMTHKWHGDSNQRWSIAETSHGYTIQSKSTGWYLDVRGAEKATGTKVQTWEENNSKAQSWGFIPVASDERPIPDGEYYIKSAAGDVYLDADGDYNYKNGTNIQIWNGKADIFKVKYISDGYYMIYEKTSGLALDVYNPSTKDNYLDKANIELYSGSDTTNRGQLWRIVDEGSGNYRLVSKLSGYSLDLHGMKTSNGSNVQQHTYNTSNAQKWSFECVHSFGAWTTKAATCKADGLQTRKCSVCGKTETKTISKTDHKYTTKVVAPTCTAKGYTEHKCSVCGDTYKDNETSAKGHSWSSWKVTKAATEDAEGVETRECSVCHEKETRAIPKLDKKTSSSSKPADSSSTAKSNSSSKPADSSKTDSKSNNSTESKANSESSKADTSSKPADSKTETSKSDDSKVSSKAETSSEPANSENDSKADTSKPESQSETSIPENSSKPEDSSKPDSKPSDDSIPDGGNDDQPTDGEDETIMLGDVNGDGEINVTDIAKVAAHIKGIKALDEKGFKAADVNGDGDVNVTDIAKIAAHIKGIKAIG